jgi:hypothetical protein
MKVKAVFDGTTMSAIRALIRAVVVLGASFGFKLDGAQTTAVYGATEAVMQVLGAIFRKV